MMSKLEGSNRHVQMNIESLSTYLQQVCLRIPVEFNRNGPYGDR